MSELEKKMERIANLGSGELFLLIFETTDEAIAALEELPYVDVDDFPYKECRDGTDANIFPNLRAEDGRSVAGLLTGGDLTRSEVLAVTRIMKKYKTLDGTIVATSFKPEKIGFRKKKPKRGKKKVQKGSIDVECFGRDEVRELASAKIPNDAKIYRVEMRLKPKKGVFGIGKRFGRYRVYFKKEPTDKLGNQSKSP